MSGTPPRSDGPQVARALFTVPDVRSGEPVVVPLATLLETITRIGEAATWPAVHEELTRQLCPEPGLVVVLPKKKPSPKHIRIMLENAGRAVAARRRANGHNAFFRATHASTYADDDELAGEADDDSPLPASVRVSQAPTQGEARSSARTTWPEEPTSSVDVECLAFLLSTSFGDLVDSSTHSVTSSSSLQEIEDLCYGRVLQRFPGLSASTTRVVMLAVSTSVGRRMDDAKESAERGAPQVICLEVLHESLNEEVAAVVVSSHAFRTLSDRSGATARHFALFADEVDGGERPQDAEAFERALHSLVSDAPRTVVDDAVAAVLVRGASLPLWSAARSRSSLDVDDGISALRGVPLLEEVTSFLHWSDVWSPERGPLGGFLQRAAASLATAGLRFVEAPRGLFYRVPSRAEATLSALSEAFHSRSVRQTSAVLVALVCFDGDPLDAVRTCLHRLTPLLRAWTDRGDVDSETGSCERAESRKDGPVLFLLDCLCAIPFALRPAFGAHVILPWLTGAVDVSAETLVRAIGALPESHERLVPAHHRVIASRRVCASACSSGSRLGRCRATTIVSVASLTGLGARPG